MLRRSRRLVCTTYRPPNGDSHGLISKYHHELTNPRVWELSTPSRALPVLGVLAHSGVIIDGVAQAAEPSLRNMTPCLTNAEVSMLGRMASFFSTARVNPPPTALSPHEHTSTRHASPNEMVRALYLSAVQDKRALDVPTAMLSDAFLGTLSVVEVTMLLELLASLQKQAGKAPSQANKLMRTLTSLLNAETSFQFDVVLSTLYSIRSWGTHDDPTKTALATLFTSCVRHIYQHLPDVTMSQHVTLYLLLLSSKNEKPFIVIKAMEDHMAAHEVDFAEVPTSSLLSLMSTPFATQHTSFTTRLSLLWYYNDRVTDMTPKESLLALHILVRLHVAENEESYRGVTTEEWQLVHDYLFAQLFAFMRQFSLPQCVAIFDALEIMNASCCSIHIPPTFAEKVRKRAFAVASGIAKRAKSTNEIDKALESFLHLKAALQRCGVLPFSDTDERLCSAIECSLHQAAKRATRDSSKVR